MTADDVRAVLLVRAVEESRGVEALLSDRERAEAVRASADRQGEEAVVARARHLADVLTERLPGLRHLTRAGAASHLTTATLFVASLLLGAGADLLGGRQVHLLQAPLLVIVALNLLLFGLLLIRTVTHANSLLFEWAAGAFARFALCWERLRTTASLEVEVTTRFAGLWLEAGRPLLWAWAQRALHLAALAFVAGAVGAMYLRALATEFRITWESTFLDASQVEGILRVVLAPGLLLLGWPDEPVASLQAPASGPAAHWIHLYALTAGLLVALPRLVLAARAHVRARQLTRDLPLPLTGAYFLRLRAPFGGPTEVRVVGYSHELDVRARDHLGALVRTLYGDRARVASHEQVDYGAALPSSELPALLLVFSLAQTPEAEVHGALAADLTADSLLVLVDAAPFAARLEGRSELEQRLGERRRGWARVLEESGVTPVHTDLSRPPDDATLEAAADALAAARERAR